MIYLLDSNVWVHCLRKKGNPTVKNLSQNRFIT